MTLIDLIDALEKVDPDLTVPLGFDNPHSYRGDYYCLAFEPRENVPVGQMLAQAKWALGKTFQGWKGGDFKMDQWTEVYLANEGSTGEEIGPTFLGMLLRDAY